MDTTVIVDTVIVTQKAAESSANEVLWTIAAVIMSITAVLTIINFSQGSAQ